MQWLCSFLVFPSTDSSLSMGTLTQSNTTAPPLLYVFSLLSLHPATSLISLHLFVFVSIPYISILSASSSVLPVPRQGCFCLENFLSVGLSSPPNDPVLWWETRTSLFQAALGKAWNRKQIVPFLLIQDMAGITLFIYCQEITWWLQCLILSILSLTTILYM